jgi:hypothetical protein
MMRVGLYRPVHVKTLRSQKLPMLLTHRKLLQSKPSRSRTICVPPCATSVSFFIRSANTFDPKGPAFLCRACNSFYVPFLEQVFDFPDTLNIS